MNKKIVLVDIQKLVAHEKIDRARFTVVLSQIRACGKVQRPVIVDKDSGVILDGHHRVQVLRKLGAIKAPVMYVRYTDNDIQVYLRRKEVLMEMIKRYVVERALSHALFPSKTTRHRIRSGRGVCHVCLSDLMRK